MIFATPWLLLALVALPLLWWVLRVVPPAPRLQAFPAVRLLLGLQAIQQTAQRTPPWILALRLVAAGLVILGLAGPTLRGGAPLPGRGTLLLVMDDGWAAAQDWPARLAAAAEVLRAAAREGRLVALLTTAPGPDGTPPASTAARPPSELQDLIGVLRPKPYPADRARAATALRAWAQAGGRGGAVFVADGITDGADWPGFAHALADIGPLRIITSDLPTARLLLPPSRDGEYLRLRVEQAPRPGPSQIDVLARAADGRMLARIPVSVAPGERVGAAELPLPVELANAVERLVLAPEPGGMPGAGGVFLLDEGFRQRPVGLLVGDVTADTPLAGAAYYIRRALGPYAALREGGLDAMLARPLSVLVLADRPLGVDEAARVRAWVEKGGLLLRFAGPATAQDGTNASPDPLLPVRLLGYERDLGGALSWSEPATLAPFAAGSPFQGLAVPDDVRVTKQVLSDPAGDLAGATWARLTDGTPLVTQRTIGAGRVVLFHVTANADWSTLPLSGLFVDMLRRVVALSAGVAGATAEGGDTALAPARTLDGFGDLGQPPAAATPVDGGAFATTRASPAHPPGLYGQESARRALNLSTALEPLEASPAVPGSAVESLGTSMRGLDIGPWLLALAALLLAGDLIASLAVRGLWRRVAVAFLFAALAAVPSAGAVEPPSPNPALAVRLAFVASGDPSVDDVARAGLGGLTAYVNARTAASLAEPASVTPGRDDLSVFPLLYWPLSAVAAPPDAAGIAALNAFMAGGGVVLIDTRETDAAAAVGGGPGVARDVLAGLAHGGAGGLHVPPLAPLTGQHVLARAFYLLGDFPGRGTGGAVWVARDEDRSNDSVSPVVVGGRDWAAAWAVDAAGRHPYATLPGGERQRTLAYRFGVNLVMYALTGNYKGDQVHVPALLERLGQ